MDPSDSAWWWQHGLDGFVGALLGGAITAGAVIATIRHERRLADLQEARSVASHLLGVAWRIRTTDDVPREDMLELGQLAFELGARSTSRWPQLETRLTSALSDWSKIDEPENLDDHAKDLARTVNALVSSWVADQAEFSEPRWYRRVVERLKPRE